MRIAAAFAALALFVAAPAAAQNTVPQIESWSIEKIVAMGREMQNQDIAAWVATDVLVAHLAGGDPGKLAGWIVVPDNDTYLVRFIEQDGEALTAGFDIRVVDGVAGPAIDVRGQPLTESEKARFRARQTAIANVGPLRCGRMNSVVAQDGDDWLVWLLTATSEAGVVPVGGHYRFRISADGHSMIRRDQLSTGCMNLQRQAEGQNTPVALFVTTLVSSLPNETHVFLSLQNRMPIGVSNRDQVIYMVEGASITKMDAPR